MGRPCHGLIVSLTVLALVGCDDGPRCIDPNGCDMRLEVDVDDGDPDMDMAVDSDPDADMAPPPPPTCDMGVPVEPGALEPFVERVQGRLYVECSACHTPGAGGGAFALVAGDPAGFDDAQHAQNRDEVAGFMDFDAPEQSVLITYHAGTGLAPSQPLVDALIAWAAPPVAAPADDCGDGGVGPDGGDDGPIEGGLVACEALPGPTSELGYSAGFWAAYAEPSAEGPPIDDLLVADCATAGCHVADGSGDGYWLMTEGDDCATRWNFLSTQWFVRPGDVLRSPLLLKPIEQPHGGRQVYQGRDDPRFIRLLRWLEGEF